MQITSDLIGSEKSPTWMAEIKMWDPQEATVKIVRIVVIRRTLDPSRKRKTTPFAVPAIFTSLFSLQFFYKP